MTHVSLFTGIGGADLAAEWAGFETVLQVEREPFALEVLDKHWPDVPRINDVREVNTDERWDKPAVISAGVPCQPASQAGKRGGAGDDRWLWPEMLRVVQTLAPRWVVAENVYGLLTIDDGMAFESICTDMEGLGYEVQPFIIPACAVDAEHRRDRVFIVANNRSQRAKGHEQKKVSGECRLSRGKNGRGPAPIGKRSSIPEPWVCRGYNGIPRGMDRVAALGNAIVPQQIYPIFAAIADTEED